MRGFAAGVARAACVALFLVGAAQGDLHAQSASVQRGQQFARANCARCHSIDRVTASRLPIAPPFRTLHQRYPVESLSEALGEGIVTAHQNMPEFRLEPDQIGDFINFLKSLE
jgi:mono/diheme cytochrome c family protein